MSTLKVFVKGTPRVNVAEPVETYKIHGNYKVDESGVCRFSLKDTTGTITTNMDFIMEDDADR